MPFTFTTRRVVPQTVEQGRLPPPAANLGDPDSKSFAEVRFPEGVYVDESKRFQLASTTGRFVSQGTRFKFKGSIVVRWEHDAEGAYTGTWWTDFSARIIDTVGRHAGQNGHFIGTRYVVGDSSFQAQSGWIIMSFVR